MNGSIVSGSTNCTIVLDVSTPRGVAHSAADCFGFFRTIVERSNLFPSWPFRLLWTWLMVAAEQCPLLSTDIFGCWRRPEGSWSSSIVRTPGIYVEIGKSICYYMFCLFDVLSLLLISVLISLIESSISYIILLFVYFTSFFFGHFHLIAPNKYWIYINSNFENETFIHYETFRMLNTVWNIICSIFVR